MLAGTLEKKQVEKKHGETRGHVIMNDLQSDMALMQRISRHDEAAFHQLYEMYGQRMFAYAYRLTNDPILAEDIMQDSLVSVWDSAKSYRGSSRLLTWLLGIVHHISTKSFRHSNQSITEEMENSVPDHSPMPEEWMQSRERTRILQAGMEKLSPDHRAVLDLVFYQGLSLNETAEVCGCPVGTVKSRLSYARNFLKGVLTRQEDLL